MEKLRKRHGIKRFRKAADKEEKLNLKPLLR